MQLFMYYLHNKVDYVELTIAHIYVLHVVKGHWTFLYGFLFEHIIRNKKL
jgi:hypothetical protein